MSTYGYRIGAEAVQTDDGWTIEILVERDTLGPGKFERFTMVVPAVAGQWPTEADAAAALLAATAGLPPDLSAAPSPADVAEA
jgi:hypothetical protein